MGRRYKKGDNLTLKDINNIKIALNYFLEKDGFDENMLDLDSVELFTILNRQSEIIKLGNGSYE